MTHWNYLQDHHHISLVAPASSAPVDIFEKTLSLTEKDFQVDYHPKFNSPDLYFAQKKEFQLQDLLSSLSSPNPVIWSLRGGYGSMRLIPDLMKLKKPKLIKCFIGFSDNTALHLFLNQKWNWPTLHGINYSSIPYHRKEYLELLKILQGKVKEKSFKLKPLNDPAKEASSIEGVIVGGNLRIIQSSLGTTWQIKTKNKILFLEDVGERGYSLDRMFEQLYQANIINNQVKAIVLGPFTEGLEKNGKDFTGKAIKRWSQLLEIPFYSNLPCGHGPRNFTLPFNTPTLIESGRLMTQFNN